MFWIIPEHSKLICLPNLSNLRFRERKKPQIHRQTDRQIHRYVNLRSPQPIGCGLENTYDVLTIHLVNSEYWKTFPTLYTTENGPKSNCVRERWNRHLCLKNDLRACRGQFRWLPSSLESNGIFYLKNICFFFCFEMPFFVPLFIWPMFTQKLRTLGQVLTLWKDHKKIQEKDLSPLI